ncbi:acyltransferase family protein [Parvicella tangerina]|uniref:Acyltransferase n=1 Tax=Parvicella tangerina TaxID=2829795 RepID=A0A916JK04_9FLAO|nr:acyltransferase family protein [Parvicella tangerina]CAG5078201.1 hypothetical protein CRYO30217_00603 [Parvicella tangerina]
MIKDSHSSINLKKYSIPIDGLRAIAVLAVIINHFKDFLLPSGYLGVDVFFVISGFVITSSLLNRKKTDLKSFFIGFYKRRVKRLVPALLFCFVIASLCISFFSLQPNRYISTGLLSIPGLSNFNLYLNAVDYWGESSKLNPFTHTWSLAVEEQFYYFYPLIIWLLFARRTAKEKDHSKSLFATIFILSLVSLGLYLYTIDTNPMGAYFLMPFRFWEIGLGCLLFFHLKRGNNDLVSRIIYKTPLTFLLLITLMIFLLPKNDTGWTTLSIGFVSYLTILKIKLCELDKLREFKVLDNPLMVYLGKISYSLYLWHWVILTIARWTIGVSITTLPILIVLFFGLSMISYHLIEMPLRHTSWRREIKPKLTLGLLMVPFLLIVYSFKFSTINRFYAGKVQEVTVDEHHNSLEPTIDNPKCSKIRVFGNSHSIHILPMLKVIADKYGIEIIKNNDPNYILIPNGTMEDMPKLDAALASLKKDDILILSSRMRYLYEIPYLNGSGEKYIDHSEIKLEQGFGYDMWVKELTEVLNKTRERGINVILFLPNVEFDVPVPNNTEICTPQWFRNISPECNPVAKKDFLESRFPEKWYAKMKQLSQENSHLFLFNPLPIYCPEGDNCPRTIEGVIAFRDTHHLTKEGALLMLDHFYSFLIEHKLL